jgi:hypothetical protein
MTHLAEILLSASTIKNEATDILWRNVNIDDLNFVGASPSDALIDEIIVLNVGQPHRLYALGRLLADVSSITHVLAHCSNADVIKGVIDNPLCSLSMLTSLSGGTNSEIASVAMSKLTYLTDLTATITGGVGLFTETQRAEAISSLLPTMQVCSLRSALDFNADQVVARLSYISKTDATNGHFCPSTRASFLYRLSIIECDLYQQFMLAILCSEYGYIDAHTLHWAMHDLNGQDYINGLGKEIRHFTKRCDSAAIEMLASHGYIKTPNKATGAPSYASLDSMADLLSPGELGAMLFSTAGKVSENTMAYVTNGVAVTMLANFMFNNTLRKPAAGEITTMLRNFSLERKLELATVMNSIYAGDVQDGAGAHADSVARLPWAHELVLAFSRTQFPHMREIGASKLYETVVERIGYKPEAWEYLMVLCNEWDSTFIDLLDSASVINQTP